MRRWCVQVIPGRCHCLATSPVRGHQPLATPPEDLFVIISGSGVNDVIVERAVRGPDPPHRELWR